MLSSPSKTPNRAASSSPPRGLRETFERIDEEQLLAAEESQEQEDLDSEMDEPYDEGDGTISGLSSIDNGTTDSFAATLTRHAREERVKQPAWRERERKWGNKGRRDVSWLQRLGDDLPEEGAGGQVKEVDDGTKEIEDRSRRVRQLVSQRKPSDLTRRDKKPQDGRLPALVTEDKKEKVYGAAVKTPASRWARAKVDLERDDGRPDVEGIDGSAEGEVNDKKKTTVEKATEKKGDSPRRDRPSRIPRSANSPSPTKTQQKKAALQVGKRDEVEETAETPSNSHQNYTNPYGRARTSVMNNESEPDPVPRGRTDKAHTQMTPTGEDTIDLLRSLSRLGSKSPSPAFQPSQQPPSKVKAAAEHSDIPPPTQPSMNYHHDDVNEPTSSDDPSLAFDPDDSLISMIRRDNVLHPNSPSPLPLSLSSRIKASHLTTMDSTLDSVTDTLPSPLPSLQTRLRSASSSSIKNTAIDAKPKREDKDGMSSAPLSPLALANQAQIEDFEVTNQKLRELSQSIRQTRKGVEILSRGVDALPPPLPEGMAAETAGCEKCGSHSHVHQIVEIEAVDHRAWWAFWPRVYARSKESGVSLTWFGRLLLLSLAYLLAYCAYDSVLAPTAYATEGTEYDGQGNFGINPHQLPAPLWEMARDALPPWLGLEWLGSGWSEGSDELGEGGAAADDGGWVVDEAWHEANGGGFDADEILR